MVDRIEEARRIVDRASDETGDATVREKLRSISEGLGEIERADDPELVGDRLAQVEDTLTGLGDEAGVDVLDRLEDARDHIDAFRRDRARNW